MKNIMKAQLFQLKRERLCFIMMAAVTVFLVFILCGERSIRIMTGSEVSSGGLTFFTGAGPSISMALFVVLILVGQMCCGDFHDKTTYYELMSGHRRCEVYFGRVIPCLIICTVSTLLMFVVPPLVITALEGWGSEISVGDALLRLVLLVFVIARIVCEYIFFSFLIKNKFIIFGLSYVLFGMYISGLFTRNTSPVLGLTSLNMLFELDIWRTYSLNYEEYVVYNASMEPIQIAFTIAVSLLASAISLTLGYVFFKNDDLN